MKTWKLVLVQLWVLSFVPVWVFLLIFAPMVLAPPNPSWFAFFLFTLPLFVSFIASITLWIAKWKDNVRWQKAMVIILIFFPVISTTPFFILE